MAQGQMAQPPRVRRRRLVRPRRITPSSRGAAAWLHTEDGKPVYAGRVGTGMLVRVLADLRRRLDLLARKTSPLSAQPPRSTRFGSLLVLSRVHWVEPTLVAEITYLTWTADGLLPPTVYVGLREDKPANQVRREVSRELDRLKK